RDGGKPDHRHFLDREQALEPGRGHCPPADAGKHRAGMLPGDRLHQGGAEAIAGFLGCDEKDREPPGPRRLARIGAGHCRCGSGMPTTKILPRSAVAATASGSAMMVAPPTTARPARPARMKPDTVCGPNRGRSKRRSCPGFGALTRTPVPTGYRMRPSLLSSAMRESMASVPSAASTATT